MVDTVVPKHYRLHLRPDFDQFTFSGHVSIHFEVKEANGSEWDDPSLVLRACGLSSINLIEFKKVSRLDTESEQRQANSASATTSANLFEREPLVKTSINQSQDDVEEASGSRPRKRKQACPGRFKRTRQDSEESNQSTESNGKRAKTTMEGEDREEVESRLESSATVRADGSLRTAAGRASPMDDEVAKRESSANDDCMSSSSLSSPESPRGTKSSWKSRKSASHEATASPMHVESPPSGLSTLSDPMRSPNPAADRDSTQRRSISPRGESVQGQRDEGEGSANPNVRVESQGLLLMRSEWIEDSDEEDLTSNTNKSTIEDVASASHRSQEPHVISDDDVEQVGVVDVEDLTGSRTDDEDEYLLDLSKSRGRSRHVAKRNSNDDEDDEEDVLQVDGGYEEDEETSSSSGEENREEIEDKDDEHDDHQEEEPISGEYESDGDVEEREEADSDDFDEEDLGEDDYKADSGDKDEQNEKRTDGDTKEDQEDGRHDDDDDEVEDQHETEKDGLTQNNQKEGENASRVDADEDREQVETQSREDGDRHQPTDGYVTDNEDHDSQNDVESPIEEEAVDVESCSFGEAGKEVYIINLTSSLKPGFYVITLIFEGVLDDSMRGFYRTRHRLQDGGDAWGAACHFEATGARKCFPCFDNPIHRSTYDISITRWNQEMKVLSNMPVKATIPSKDQSEGEIVEFSRSPPMPTYLVCAVLGYYDTVNRRTKDGVEVTVYTPPGEAKQGSFALDVATRSLAFYKEFFGVGYPLPKMDLVAVPDFYIGAMENWGLLTFRETALLYQEGVSNIDRKKYVAILVCHEIAHQWFGNLVSIKGWGQLWLKEGFATWVSFLAVDRLFPELGIWSEFLLKERFEALNMDILANSHPIEVNISPSEEPGEIDEIFDAICYSKGAAVIHMLFAYIGEERFRQGMVAYLSKYKYKSVSTDKLWNSIESVVPNVKVAQIMHNWTKKQGFPFIFVRRSENGREWILSQESSSRWKIPLMIQDGEEISAVLHDGEPMAIRMRDPNVIPIVNKGQAAFCRVVYDKGLYSSLTRHFYALDPIDRAGILSDMSSFIISGMADAKSDSNARLRELVNSLDLWSEGQLTDWVGVECVLEVLATLEALAEQTKAWSSFLRLNYRILYPILMSIGWNTGENETRDDKPHSRASVIDRLGRLGHIGTVGEAWHLYRAESADRIKISTEIRGAVYRTVARNGGKRSDLEQIKQRYEVAATAEERRMLLTVIASFTGPDLIKEILGWIWASVKQQDRVFGITSVAANSLEGRYHAWRFFKDNYDDLSRQYTSGCLLTNLVKGVTKHFCKEEDADAVQAFFNEHENDAVTRTVKQVLEDIRSVARRRQACEKSILRIFSDLDNISQG